MQPRSSEPRPPTRQSIHRGPEGGPDVRPEALLGVLAHELRTPITTIYAGSAVLARDEALLPAMRRELAADVQAEAARLFRAVEDLLVLTRLEHDALEVSREPISMARMVEGAAQLEAARWPDLQMALRLDGSAPPVAADAAATAHALRNLIANIGSRTHGPSDLVISVASEPDGVVTTLVDRTGSLEADDLPALFDLPAGDPRPGMASPGIALFVAARLIEAMQGTIWARQRVDDAAAAGPPVGDHPVIEIGFRLPRYASA